MKPWFARNWFNVGLIAVVILGFLLPREIGQFLYRWSAWIAGGAIFVTGLKFDVRTLDFRRSFAVGVALSTVISLLLAPVLFRYSVGWFFDGGMFLGLIILSALPTTIVSNIALCDASRGNTAMSSVSTVVINTGGLVTIPIVLALFAGENAGAQSVSAADLLQTLFWVVVLPNVASQFMHLLVPAKATQTLVKATAFVPRGVVLLFIFLGVILNADRLRDAAQDKPLFFAELVLIVVLLHAALLAISWVSARLLRLGWEDRVSVLFASSQKTLTIGIALVSQLFPDVTEAILPLILYQVTSLFADGILANGLAKRHPSRRAER